ncbi:ArsB/NhaD family transporter [Heliophilum fasciatum]|uniref:Putative tyrosine transporter P-protein n=1 Tax=Heliophilum fasciatum TaxID=35700 RepID=A0A4R2RYU4_9FIRM|nr:ArsB/NhaD family transporter [Heliophilum fasciatum]MCW2276835.1 Na+/H+ antiporter NhaD/arsenite permease-like protein [Heliophilum fasciatum]TCP68704.1 putative tyrosine transporter P-protein [Heliophilum fasciatum]
MNDFAFWVSIIIFVLIYGLIIWEKIPRAITAMLGGLIMILLGFLSQEVAVQDDIDFNTIGLLIGMMILVAITRRTGIFEALAIWAAKITGGHPLYLLGLMALITAVASALLDNVTTVLLIAPITIILAETLKLPPLPFLITEIIASNIGGTATLIGDPPNIMIGSATGLGFVDFLIHMAPIAIIIMVVTIAILMFLYRNELQRDADDRRSILALSPQEAIKDWALLKKSLFVLGVTIIAFMLHSVLHLESATVALTGAMLLMIISREEPEEILLLVEWPTIFFFAGLFVLVGGLKATGVIAALANWSLTVTQGDPQTTALLVLWLSAIASGFIDNIPFVATMIPMLQEMGSLSGMPLDTIWWALALGACLGGNGTLVGASANIIVAGIAEKAGVPISFRQFFVIGFPLMLLSVAIAHGYLYLRYF